MMNPSSEKLQLHLPSAIPSHERESAFLLFYFFRRSAGCPRSQVTFCYCSADACHCGDSPLHDKDYPLHSPPVCFGFCSGVLPFSKQKRVPEGTYRPRVKFEVDEDVRGPGCKGYVREPPSGIAVTVFGMSKPHEDEHYHSFLLTIPQQAEWDVGGFRWEILRN
ncbi:hypothetical protein TNCV_635961 [Trichonephila clavipes]|nr:hypothetical protein TNCV_635961 [Trichonephila clavipes]